MQKIPTTIITGFLGAGKTTLIQYYLQHTSKKCSLLINEFGAVGVDKELLSAKKSCSVSHMIELTNGCICCTVADDFLPALEQLLAQDSQPEHIIIETSGLALPKPLVKAFTWPTIRPYVTVDSVITLLDAPQILKGIFLPSSTDNNTNHENPLEELFEDQLSLADIALLNKCDQITPQDQDDIIAQLRRHDIHCLRDETPIIPIKNGKIHPDVIFGIGSALEDNVHKRPSHHDDIDGEHDHDDFTSFDIVIKDITNIEQKIHDILKRYPIYRIKGFLVHEHKKFREVIHVAGANIDRYFDRPWHDDERKESRIIIIGAKKLDDVKNDIQHLFE